MKKRSESASWSLIVGVAVIGLVVGYLVGTAGQNSGSETAAREDLAPVGRAPVQTRTSDPTGPIPASGESGPATDDIEADGSSLEPPAIGAGSLPEPGSAELEPIPSGKGSRIALVIDDLGRSVQDVTDLSELGVPITFAVLPFETLTAEVTEELKRKGAELLVHLPMQPTTNADPGPGALLREMNEAQLAAATRWALDAVSGASGVNNHMGSELSADSASMRTILGVVAERNLYFLDSRTSPDSVGYRLALEMGLAAAERQVFLDTDANRTAIRGQFRRLLEVARERGTAVAIGHPHRETLAILREEIPRAVAAGFEFVRVSDLTRRAGPEAPAGH